ncbi:MAG TPA: hypothetical protein VGY13_02335 [Solirubrobacteraceae bacterium]|jgi:hypothetical protein|nr:hypothetical protein [Solirubrobacteraceae bacterium]
MSVELLERAAQALEPVLGDVVFLGGASIVLWITDPAAPAPRPTKDVDVVVEVTSRAAFHTFEERLRSLGFKDDQGTASSAAGVTGTTIWSSTRCRQTQRSSGSRTAGREPRSRTLSSVCCRLAR